MAAIAHRLRVFALLVQRLGPYVLLEILLPGGTLVALLLFLWRQRREAGGRRPLPALALARLHAAAQAVLVRVPFDRLVPLVDNPPERDGLEPLGMAPT